MLLCPDDEEVKRDSSLVLSILESKKAVDSDEDDDDDEPVKKTPKGDEPMRKTSKGYGEAMGIRPSLQEFLQCDSVTRSDATKVFKSAASIPVLKIHVYGAQDF